MQRNALLNPNILLLHLVITAQPLAQASAIPHLILHKQ